MRQKYRKGDSQHPMAYRFLHQERENSKTTVKRSAMQIVATQMIQNTQQQGHHHVLFNLVGSKLIVLETQNEVASNQYDKNVVRYAQL